MLAPYFALQQRFGPGTFLRKGAGNSRWREYHFRGWTLRGSGSCRESSVSDRYGRSPGPAQSYKLGVELRRQRRDDAGTKAGFWLGKATLWLPNPIVSDR